MNSEQMQKFVDSLQRKSKENAALGEKNRDNPYLHGYYMGIAQSLNIVAIAFHEAVTDKTR